jgi:putative transcriptional regulator
MEAGYMTGQLLIAMPQMEDSRFARTLIYVCAHTAEGAMGLVINRAVDNVTFPDLLRQLNIMSGQASPPDPILFGGPVETGRGFVLHSSDYVRDATLLVDHEVGLTATLDILKDIAAGHGPRRSLLMLGYAGWGPGQLDAELARDDWFVAPAGIDDIFDTDAEELWRRVLARKGGHFALVAQMPVDPSVN